MTLQWRGKYLEVHRDGTWEYVARTGNMGAAVILAVTEGREIVLVEQHRMALGTRTIELPAGLIGDVAADEDPALTAARELEEEAGFTAVRMEEVGDFATSPGMSREMFRLYRAHGLTRTATGGGVDGEDIAVHVVPLDGLGGWLDAQRARGCVIDCRLIVALGLL